MWAAPIAHPEALHRDADGHDLANRIRAQHERTSAHAVLAPNDGKVAVVERDGARADQEIAGAVVRVLVGRFKAST